MLSWRCVCVLCDLRTNHPSDTNAHVKVYTHVWGAMDDRAQRDRVCDVRMRSHCIRKWSLDTHRGDCATPRCDDVCANAPNYEWCFVVCTRAGVRERVRLRRGLCASVFWEESEISLIQWCAVAAARTMTLSCTRTRFMMWLAQVIPFRLCVCARCSNCGYRLCVFACWFRDPGHTRTSAFNLRRMYVESHTHAN